MADTPSTNSPSTVFGADNSICADQSKQGTELSAAISQLESRIQSTLDLNKKAVDEIQEWKASRIYPERIAIETVEYDVSQFDNTLKEMKEELGWNGVTREDVDASNERSVPGDCHPHASFWALVMT